MSAISVVFDVPDMTTAKYDQVIKDLIAAGQGNPPGRLYHVCSTKGNGCQVVDVWTSGETLNQFAGTLMPILAKNGVTPPQPQITPVHNVIK